MPDEARQVPGAAGHTLALPSVAFVLQLETIPSGLNEASQVLQAGAAECRCPSASNLTAHRPRIVGAGS